MLNSATFEAEQLCRGQTDGAGAAAGCGQIQYCRAQSTDIEAPAPVSPPVLSSWMHRCIRRGGKCATLVVSHHIAPSTNAAIRHGVHSTAQLCHCVASTAISECSRWSFAP